MAICFHLHMVTVETNSIYWLALPWELNGVAPHLGKCDINAGHYCLIISIFTTAGIEPDVCVASSLYNLGHPPLRRAERGQGAWAERGQDAWAERGAGGLSREGGKQRPKKEEDSCHALKLKRRSFEASAPSAAGNPHSLQTFLHWHLMVCSRSFCFSFQSDCCRANGSSH